MQRPQWLHARRDTWLAAGLLACAELVFAVTTTSVLASPEPPGRNPATSALIVNLDQNPAPETQGPTGPPRSPAPPSAVVPRPVKSERRIWKNSLGMEFVRLEPGEFMMGTSPAQVEHLLRIFPDAKAAEFDSEQPAHTVRLTRPFDLGRHKITIGQFHQFVMETQYPADADADNRIGAKPRPWFPQAEDHPMVNVSWNDVHAFCDWLNAREKGRYTYRLPTEAEWEYACRAGTSTVFPNGDDPEKLALIGNVADASARKRYPDWSWTIKADDGHIYTSAVGAFAPNAWGLYDTIGNVWEWCEDSFDPHSYRTVEPVCVDPTGPAPTGTRVVRGGCWFLPPRRCRPADRGGFAPGFRCSFLGFRLVAVPAS